MSIKVYGIPNCTTCQKALKWLDENSITYEFINTKINPPNQEIISDWVKSLTAKAMRNTSGQSYRALGEDRQTWTDEQWIEAFAKDAMLIKRPLIVKDGKGVIVGFRAKDSELRHKMGI